jgi:hypothetical protein
VDTFDRERGGVGVDADTDPAAIGGDVVDAPRVKTSCPFPAAKG